MRKILGLGVALLVALALVAVSPASATATSTASTSLSQQVSPNWWTCSSYDKVCLFVDVSGDPLGRQLNVYSVGVGCINLNSTYNDAITSIDNGWNDADIRFRGWKHANCVGTQDFYVDGNDAVSMNQSSAWWGHNDNMSSFRVDCVDLLGNCYYGP